MKADRENGLADDFLGRRSRCTRRLFSPYHSCITGPTGGKENFLDFLLGGHTGRCLPSEKKESANSPEKGVNGGKSML